MITNEDVLKLAKLSRLRFKEEQIPILTKQLAQIVEMINVLDKVDCPDIKPLTSVCNMTQRMREDEVLYDDISHELFNNLSDTQAKLAREVKCFIVPKVVE